MFKILEFSTNKGGEYPSNFRLHAEQTESPRTVIDTKTASKSLESTQISIAGDVRRLGFKVDPSLPYGIFIRTPYEHGKPVEIVASTHAALTSFLATHQLSENPGLARSQAQNSGNEYTRLPRKAS